MKINVRFSPSADIYNKEVGVGRILTRNAELLLGKSRVTAGGIDPLRVGVCSFDTAPGVAK